MTVGHEQQPTHYVLPQGPNCYVKEANFYMDQGGHIKPWGTNWIPVIASDIEDARRIAKEIRDGK